VARAAAVARAKSGDSDAGAEGFCKLLRQPAFPVARTVHEGNRDDPGVRPDVINVPTKGLLRLQMPGDAGGASPLRAAHVRVQSGRQCNEPQAAGGGPRRAREFQPKDVEPAVGGFGSLGSRPAWVRFLDAGCMRVEEAACLHGSCPGRGLHRGLFFVVLVNNFSPLAGCSLPGRFSLPTCRLRRRFRPWDVDFVNRRAGKSKGVAAGRAKCCFRVASVPV